MKGFENEVRVTVRVRVRVPVWVWVELESDRVRITLAFIWMAGSCCRLNHMVAMLTASMMVRVQQKLGLGLGCSGQFLI